MQLTQAGVLTSAATHEVRSGQRDQDFRRGSGHAMPAPWVRATMVVRCNATVRGHSAVSLPILQAVMRLLENRITPVVPLRGSVSASGDLMPLAYIAGAIEGSPDIYVEMSRANRTVLPARDALQLQGIDAVRLGPKEGLGLVNGTASSAALGALVMYEVHHLSVLVQALTGMAVEVSVFKSYCGHLGY
jgi:phenylalanine ammonia-lyase